MSKTLFEAVNDQEKVPDLEQATYDVLCFGHCRCGNPGTEEHTCPYAEDINNDSESLCNCCNECAGQCAMDI